MSSEPRTQSYYTNGYDAAVSKTHSWRTVENCCKYFKDLIKPTDSILDVGCGPGSITLDLAKYVPNGKVTGIEPVKELIEECLRSMSGQENVKFEVADAYKLPYPDNAFDIVHCHQVLIHLDDPALVLKEMRRVCKPDGIVCCKEFDAAMTVVYPEQYVSTLGGYIVKNLKASKKNSASEMGRSLKALAMNCGFAEKDVVFSMDNWCYSTPEERQSVGERYIGRLLHSKEQFEENDPSTNNELQKAFIAGWKQWISDDKGILVLNSGEVVCSKTI